MIHIVVLQSVKYVPVENTHLRRVNRFVLIAQLGEYLIGLKHHFPGSIQVELDVLIALQENPVQSPKVVVKIAQLENIKMKKVNHIVNLAVQLGKNTMMLKVVFHAQF